MELFEALGLDIKILIAQIINFLILIFVLKKFLYGPVVGMLEKRRQTIAKGLKDAEEAEKKLAKAEKETTKIQEKAYTEAKEILQSAQTEAKKSAEEIVAKANAQAAATLDLAGKEAQDLKKKALNQARTELANLVMIAVEKIVSEDLEKSQMEKLTARAVREL